MSAISKQNGNAHRIYPLIVRAVLPLTPQTRREFEVNIALIAETPANPGLARIRDHAHTQLLELFSRIAAMLRDETDVSDESRRDGRRILALVDGLALHLLHQPLEDDSGWAVEILREELEQIRAGNDLRRAV